MLAHRLSMTLACCWAYRIPLSQADYSAGLGVLSMPDLDSRTALHQFFSREAIGVILLFAAAMVLELNLW